MKQGEEKTRGNCKVEWIDAGEGQWGMYRPEDPNDMRLLRFRSYAKDGDRWMPIQNGSVKTQVRVEEGREMHLLLLDKLLDRIAPRVEQALASEAVRNGALILPEGGEFFEQLAWFGPEMAEEY